MTLHAVAVRQVNDVTNYVSEYTWNYLEACGFRINRNRSCDDPRDINL